MARAVGRDPWLSVIIPTYNGASYLREAFESVVAQADERLEVIVVDDGSSDETLSIVAAYSSRLPIRVEAREHGGNWVKNTNAALSLARGEFVAILHQDDYWMPGRLAALRRVLGDLEEKPALVVHSSLFVDSSSRSLGVWRCPLPVLAEPLPPEVVMPRLLIWNFVAVPSVLFSRRAAIDAGGLDESLWFLADWDLWLKLAMAGTTAHIPRPLSAFRIHRGSQTVEGSARVADIQDQARRVFNGGKCAWEAAFGILPDGVLAGARLSREVSVWTLARGMGTKAPGQPVLRAAALAGFTGWRRFLRDSRIAERVLARVRARWRSVI